MADKKNIVPRPLTLAVLSDRRGEVQFPPNTFEVSITRLSLNSFIVIRVVMSLEMLAKSILKHLS